MLGWHGEEKDRPDTEIHTESAAPLRVFFFFRGPWRMLTVQAREVDWGASYWGRDAARDVVLMISWDKSCVSRAKLLLYYASETKIAVS